MSITQQLNTLLYHLTTQQKPNFVIDFWSLLTNISFDYSYHSLEKIQNLFHQLTTQGYTVEKLSISEGGRNFMLAMSSYFGDYLVKNVGGRLVWFDYSQASTDIAEQNQKHQTNISFPANFDNSLVARINENLYLQPLQMIDNLLQGKMNLPHYMAEMQKNALEKIHIDLNQDANQVVIEYLSLVKTGKIYQTNIGFYNEISHIDFDYSEKSLQQIDLALDNIKQKYNISGNDYMKIIEDAKNQTFLYLLGFYVGITSSRLANVAIRWVNYQQMFTMLNQQNFPNCIEHSFVLLMENHYRLPILVLTNRLFAIAPNMPTSTVEFAKIIDKDNRGQLNIFLQNDKSAQAQIAQLPKTWQTMAKQMGVLLVKQLLNIAKQQKIEPMISVSKIDPTTQKHTIQMQAIVSANADKAIDDLYQQLSNNPYLLPYQLACFDMYANLPVGRTDGIMFELRTYDEGNLQLQFILPYQKRGKDFVFFPLLNNQANMPNQAHSIAQIVYLSALQLLQKTQADKGVAFWQSHFVETLDLYGMTQMENLLQEKNKVLVENIDIPLLPFSNQMPVKQDLPPESPTIVEKKTPKIQPVMENTPQNSGNESPVYPQTMPQNLPNDFNYSINYWKNFDISQTIAQLPPEQKEYLQVLVPDKLLNDELLSQAQAMTDLYKKGRVTWAVVVEMDKALAVPDTLVTDGLSYTTASDVVMVDILYDTTGQTSIEQLQHYAQQLTSLANQDCNQLPADQSIIAIHLQDKSSRLFSYAFPFSLAKTPCQFGRMWVWRPHLPNGMMSGAVLPILFDFANGGRVMTLPARFWTQEFYQYWLNMGKKQLNSVHDFDLMPKILEQEKQGLRYGNPSFTPRLFPKYKHEFINMSDNVELNQTANPSSVDMNHLAPMNSKMANLPLELQQQLMKDQERLRTTLTTSDKNKDKKLFIIVGVLVGLLLLGFIIVKIFM